jgi:hypothetical protein
MTTTSSPFDRKLTWNEQKRAQEIARQLILIYRHQPEILDGNNAALVATLIHKFNARYITPKEYERIKRLERD